MEQRLAVHAGHHAEALSSRRFTTGQRWRWMLVLSVVVSASVADARPTRRDARAAFERGVAAYSKRNFSAASDALARSFELERDADTLFAWAQAQRQLGNYTKAIELYSALLGFSLAAKNRAAVEAQLAECRDALAGQQPTVVQPPRVAALPDEPEAQVGASSPPVGDRPAPDASAAVVRPAVAPPPAAVIAPERASWYRDPIALGLAGSGILVTAVGGGLLYTAWSLDQDSKAAFESNQYDMAQSLADRAKSRDTLAVVTMGVGGVLVVGGAVWIATHRGKEHASGHAAPGSARGPVDSSPGWRTVTGWVAPGSAGLAVFGAF